MIDKMDETTENFIYPLTEDDCEEMLVQMDALYWAFLNLTRKRSMRINFNPTHWAGQLRGLSRSDGAPSNKTYADFK